MEGRELVDVKRDFIDRNEILVMLGFQGGALMGGSVAGCSTALSAINPSGTVNFTSDLSISPYTALNSNGGYVIYRQVVVAKTTSCALIAITQLCSHQGNYAVTYDSSSNSFYCPVHGARYDTNSKGLNSFGKGNLTIYKTSLAGTLLTVSS